MRYSIEPRDRKYVKGYGFLSFNKNVGTHSTKVAKNMSNKYVQILLNSAKNSSKRAIQKTAEATGDLIGNKIADKISSISKSPQNASKELHPKTNETEIEIPKERYIFPEKKTTNY